MNAEKLVLKILVISVILVKYWLSIGLYRLSHLNNEMIYKMLNI